MDKCQYPSAYWHRSERCESSISLITNTHALPRCTSPASLTLRKSERVKNKAMSGITDRPVITVFLCLNSVVWALA